MYEVVADVDRLFKDVMRNIYIKRLFSI